MLRASLENISDVFKTKRIRDPTLANASIENLRNLLELNLQPESAMKFSKIDETNRDL